MANEPSYDTVEFWLILAFAVLFLVIIWDWIPAHGISDLMRHR